MNYSTQRQLALEGSNKSDFSNMNDGSDDENVEDGVLVARPNEIYDMFDGGDEDAAENVVSETLNASAAPHNENGGGTEGGSLGSELISGHIRRWRQVTLALNSATRGGALHNSDSKIATNSVNGIVGMYEGRASEASEP